MKPFLLSLALCVTSQAADLTVPVSPLEGVAGEVTNSTVMAVGGVAPYQWSIIKGSLPTGLLIYPNGRLSGTYASVGNFTYTLRVKDADGTTVDAEFTNKVVPPVFGTKEDLVWTFDSRKQLWVARIFMFVAVWEDWHTTIKCVRLPNGVCSEANPVLIAAGINPATARGSQQLLALKIGEPLAIIGTQELLRRKRYMPNKTLEVGTWIFDGVQTLVDIHNRTTTVQLQQKSVANLK